MVKVFAEADYRPESHQEKAFSQVKEDPHHKVVSAQAEILEEEYFGSISFVAHLLELPEVTRVQVFKEVENPG